MSSRINWEKLEKEMREIKPVPADAARMASYDSETEAKLEVFLAEQARYREQSELNAMKERFN